MPLIPWLITEFGADVASVGVQNAAPAGSEKESLSSRVGEFALGHSGSERDLKTVTESNFHTCAWCTVTKTVFRIIYIIRV